MLQCRRHEKDFLARRDTAYVSRYVAAYDRVSVGAKDIDAAIPSLSILRHMENYRLGIPRHRPRHVRSGPDGERRSARRVASRHSKRGASSVGPR